MKKVLSISLGSSKRDHRVETEILGEKFKIERRGTDGDQEEAYRLFTELDGQYDAFGLGGIDLYLYTKNRRYVFKDARRLIKNVKKTPAVDGSGLKNTLEKMVIDYLNNEYGLNFNRKKVLMVSAVDRFGMAQAFESAGAELIIGDLIFALGIPIPIHSLKALHVVATTLLPLITRLPFELVYPTGNKQENSDTEKAVYTRYYREADVIAGDFHFIKRYLPDRLEGKIIITNTITDNNIMELKKRGTALLVTTTPELEGRSFGTNVMEGVLVALAEKRPEDLSEKDYITLLKRMDFKPRIINLKEGVV